MNKNKTIWIIVGIVVIVLIVIFATRSKQGILPASTPFKIGIVLPLSGPAAALGEASKNSVNLALSKLSPSEQAKIVLIYGDDQLDPKQTVLVTQKLIDVDKVDALVTYSSPSSVAASYIAEKNSVPMIGLGNSTDINSGKQWVIRYMLGPEAQAAAIENLLLKGKYHKVAMVWNQSDGPKSVHDALAKMLPERGYTIVADESVAKGENDFKTSITKIRSAKPDVVVVYISPQTGVFAKQAKDLSLNAPLVGGPTFEIVDQIKAAAGGMDDQLFASNDNVSFINNYYAKYASYPTIAGDYIYDAITQLATVANQPDVSRESIMKYLKNSFSGVAGNYIYNGDGSFDVVQVVKKWDGQEFVVIK
ncbi:MAG: ABC transporter substrate-binding protein [Candidatus Paceibacterota bacterium]